VRTSSTTSSWEASTKTTEALTISTTHTIILITIISNSNMDQSRSSLRAIYTSRIPTPARSSSSNNSSNRRRLSAKVWESSMKLIHPLICQGHTSLIPISAFNLEIIRIKWKQPWWMTMLTPPSKNPITNHSNKLTKGCQFRWIHTPLKPRSIAAGRLKIRVSKTQETNSPAATKELSHNWSMWAARNPIPPAASKTLSLNHPKSITKSDYSNARIWLWIKTWQFQMKAWLNTNNK
jgi:hypothetical protein